MKAFGPRKTPKSVLQKEALSSFFASLFRISNFFLFVGTLMLFIKWSANTDSRLTAKNEFMDAISALAVQSGRMSPSRIPHKTNPQWAKLWSRLETRLIQSEQSKDGWQRWWMFNVLKITFCNLQIQKLFYIKGEKMSYRLRHMRQFVWKLLTHKDRRDVKVSIMFGYV